jgi:hypothetical protein
MGKINLLKTLKEYLSISSAVLRKKLYKNDPMNLNN